MTQRIGLFGGCFNPVHNGHIALARAGLANLGLDTVIFIPSGLPPLKGGQGLLPGEQRLAMLQSALAREPGLELCTAEIARAGPSFTVDTVRTLREGLAGDVELFFLLGSDCLDRLPRWKGIDELHAMLRFVVIQRPGANRDITDPRLLQLATDLPVVSSTLVRQRLARAERVSDLVPPPVERFLELNRPYDQFVGAAA